MKPILDTAEIPKPGHCNLSNASTGDVFFLKTVFESVEDVLERDGPFFMRVCGPVGPGSGPVPCVNIVSGSLGDLHPDTQIVVVNARILVRRIE